MLRSVLADIHRKYINLEANNPVASISQLRQDVDWMQYEMGELQRVVDSLDRRVPGYGGWGENYFDMPTSPFEPFPTSPAESGSTLSTDTEQGQLLMFAPSQASKKPRVAPEPSQDFLVLASNRPSMHVNISNTERTPAIEPGHHAPPQPENVELFFLRVFHYHLA